MLCTDTDKNKKKKESPPTVEELMTLSKRLAWVSKICYLVYLIVLDTMSSSHITWINDYNFLKNSVRAVEYRPK